MEIFILAEYDHNEYEQSIQHFDNEKDARTYLAQEALERLGREIDTEAEIDLEQLCKDLSEGTCTEYKQICKNLSKATCTQYTLKVIVAKKYHESHDSPLTEITT